MGLKYEHLLSPIMVRNFVIKNRMVSANSLPHFLQGPENYPADSVITHYANRAKSGASIVTCMGINNDLRGKYLPFEEDIAHFPDMEMYDGRAQNYFVQLADAIHFYNSLACMSLFVPPGSDYLVRKADGIHRINGFMRQNELTVEELEDIAEFYAQQSLQLKRLGFDMVSIHAAYHMQLPSQMLSPLTNHRTDEYGGSLENRMRFPLMILQKIRERVGNQFLIEILVSAEDSKGSGGMTIEETAEFLKRAEKYADIAQLRCPEIDPAHPTGFTMEEIPFVDYAAYMKKQGINMLIETIGGYQKFSTCDAVIREGKADLIGMARSWISNPDYGKLAYEGREEDMVPCLRCNKCHGRGRNDVFASVCSVNPKIGIEHRLDMLTSAPGSPKRAAVIGGGPAGMKAAIDLCDRGHQVVLFEATDQLGGQMKHSDHVDFKWPLKEFKDYLIRQMEKRPIEVRYNLKATGEMIKKEGFDVVIAALGAVPKKITFPGLDSITHVDALTAFEHPEDLGKQVVVIGGGEVGVECGMYLSRQGHEVHVIEMRDELAADTTLIHYRTMFQAAWESIPDFHGITGAVCQRVEDGCVVFLRDGVEQRIPADSIVVSVGMNPLTEEALNFYNTADRMEMVGDCRKPATIEQAMRSAFAVASNI